MTGSFRLSLDALAGECERSEAALRRSTPHDLTRPTRCEAWDVRGLVGHMLRDVERITDYGRAPEPDRADTSAAGYFASYDPVGDAPAVAMRSIERAAAFGSVDELVDAFAASWRASVELAADVGPDRLIAVRWGPTMRLDQYIDTRVLEIAVHGLDLARALDTPPWLTPAGGSVTRAILSELLGDEPPRSWGDVELAEKGTGRATLTAADREALGLRTERFPLLA